MTFTFRDRSVYYESHGKGDPLLILNGIFMSCASWAAFIQAFSKDNRLLLLDFLDQGRSGKMNAEYTQALQEELVVAFLDHAGIERVHLLGISYGGEVAMRIAARHPARVKKLILSNTTAYTSPWLKDIGRAWEYAFRSGDGRQFFKTCIPTIYSPGFYEKNYAWARAREDLFVKVFTQDVYDAFGRLTRSAETHDERGNLKRITAPTLVLSSEYDFITPVFLQRELAAAIPDAEHAVIPDAGHASMYEKPEAFTALALGFVNLNAEIKPL
jgi:pimeloyl-ACP methyl ester carboxylesterase